MRGCSAESPNSALPFQSVCAQWGGSYLASRWYRTAEQNAAEVGNGDSHHSYKTLAAAITALRYFDNFTRKKAAGIRGQGRTPLFRSTIGKTGILTGLQAKIGYHTFRATGITAYLGLRRSAAPLGGRAHLLLVRTKPASRQGLRKPCRNPGRTSLPSPPSSWPSGGSSGRRS